MDPHTSRIRLFVRSVLAALSLCVIQPAHAEDVAFVVLGPAGTQTIRVITDKDQCPAVEIDGRRVATHLRMAPATEPQRTTASTPDLSKPAEFPVTTCDLQVSRKVAHASFQGQPLPLARPVLSRLIVIGDTGCRLKAADKAYQACNDPAKYPFAQIAARAAAWKPDAVIHVGDYEYRENPCPDGNTGCAGSPWGYGWDAWKADFFEPGRALLATAPLILTRGNHENCNRAGQGWWRFLDPRPLVAGRDCNADDQDVTGNYSEPYAVALGRHAQIVVLDLSNSGGKVIDRSDPRFDQFAATYDTLDQLSKGEEYTFAVDHYPILGVAASNKGGELKLSRSGASIQSVFTTRNPLIVPPHVDVLLAGHVHLWEQLSFASDHPSQIVTGFSGTEEDKVPLPQELPADFTPADGASVNAFASWIDHFGYMTLERTGLRTWTAEVHDLDGNVVTTCRIDGKKSICTPLTSAAKS